MANQQNLEFEEAITCPVCLSRFDESEKKPKYLVSCCHTICRLCLETISRAGILKRITCPICRCPTDCSSGVDSLPTNSDKLYLLKLEKPLNKSDDEALNWCFTCRKRTSSNCASENHSVIVMNPQLLNNDIQLNMATITSRLRVCGQAILQNRKEIGSKLDHISRWLSSHQEMIETMKTINSSRISELSDMIQGSDITISIQKLMQLSINKEADLGLLTDNLQEEAFTKKLLEEFEVVENTAEISTMGRFCSLLDLPSVPYLRKELDYLNFFQNQTIRSHWPIVLIESLAASNKNLPVSTNNDESRVAENNFMHFPLFQPHQTERLHRSRYFSSLTSPTTTTFSSNAGNNVSRIEGASRIAEPIVPVFRFGTSGAATTSSPGVGTREREFLFARRRRYPRNLDEAHQ